jgi:hypothetical protein
MKSLVELSKDDKLIGEFLEFQRRTWKLLTLNPFIENSSVAGIYQLGIRSTNAEFEAKDRFCRRFDSMQVEEIDVLGFCLGLYVPEEAKIETMDAALEVRGHYLEVFHNLEERDVGFFFRNTFYEDERYFFHSDPWFQYECITNTAHVRHPLPSTKLVDAGMLERELAMNAGAIEAVRKLSNM